MNYTIYKNIRTSAWQCLIDYNVTELPVKISRIAYSAGINIVKNSNHPTLSETQVGATLKVGKELYIIYDDTLPPTRCRFTIAHELGHIFLGHISQDYTTMGDERSANMFATRILAPACILHELCCTTPYQIAKLCNISMQSARFRAERMTILERRNKWYADPLEQKVCQQFSEYIKKQKSLYGWTP